MELLYDSDYKPAKRLSSINQFKDFLAVQVQGEWVPICFDVIDGIVCGHIQTHKAILALEPFIGFHYQVDECHYSKTEYLLGDDFGVETKKLPAELGSGFYQSAFNRKIFVNGDNGSLSLQNDKTLRIGTDYIDVDDEIEADDYRPLC